MESFARLVAAMLSPLIKQATAAFTKQASATVALVGYCPLQKKGRAFLLRTDPFGSAPPAVQELTPLDGPTYFGSGSALATEIQKATPALTPPEVTKAAIASGKDDTIGGRVQYGRLQNEHFAVYAVHDFDVDHHTKTVVPGYFLAGLELMAPQSLTLPEGFELLPPIVDPFGKERDQLLANGYKVATRYSHFQVLFDGAAIRAKAAAQKPDAS